MQPLTDRKGNLVCEFGRVLEAQVGALPRERMDRVRGIPDQGEIR